MSRLSMYIQVYTLHSSVRPFGCSTILGGIDETGPGLYVIEPSGVSYVSAHIERVTMRKLTPESRATTARL